MEEYKVIALFKKKNARVIARLRDAGHDLTFDVYNASAGEYGYNPKAFVWCL